jgi:diguanylate cyclase (GGDEF)-like protein
MFTKKTGIGNRIARLIAISTFASVLFAATILTVLRINSEIDARRSALEATAFALASAAGEAVATNDKPRAMSALAAIARVPDIEMAAIVSKDGTTLANMGHSTYLTTDVVKEDDSKLALIYKGKLPISVDIIKGGVFCGQLVMIGDISGLRTQLYMTVLTTLAAALFVALLGALLARPLQRRITLPLSTLTHNMQALRSSRDYSVNLVDDETPDETGVLTKAFNGLMQDIRFRDQSLKQLAYNDPLTGLPNRVSFQRSLGEWLEVQYRPSYGAIALVNIHDFRTMNDAFSHSIGDAILMTVAAVIKSAIKEDMVLARYGGDEFALLMPGAIDEADVEMSVARIQSAFFKAIQIGELHLHIQLTSGAVLLHAGADPDTSLRHSDLALAEAKKLVSGRVQFFQNAMAENVKHDTEMGQALRQATHEGKFELHYQPQLDLRTDSISGFEALVRWTHPTQGPVSPAVFIPLAERIGLVSVIGDWVLAEGCRQAATWYRQGQNTRILSVNISPAQILAAGFVEKVRNALKKSGLPPKLLCLELTESIFVGSRFAETIVILEALAKDGIKLALDDFGTGYSSLSYLSKLPFDTIKIDRSFVSNADKNIRKANMLKSIVEMIRSLDMGVVAEGAETQEELALLRKLQVHQVQGFVVSKPIPAYDALALASEIDATSQLANVG